MPRLALTRMVLVWPLSCLALVCALTRGVSAHGGFEERIEAADRAVEAAPTDPEPRLVRAELYRRHGDFDAALRDLDDATRLSPRVDRLEYFRGLVYLDSDRPAEAETSLRRFLEREPKHPAGHEAHARALLQLGRPLAAARAYDRVIALQPVPVPDRFIERARAFAAAGDIHLEEAIRGIDAGIAKIGPLVTLERVAIDLELRHGATDAALARLEGIEQRSARRETWLVQRGRILAKLGRTEEAKQSFSRALAELGELSPHRRRTPAMSQLESEIHASLARLANPAKGSTP